MNAFLKEFARSASYSTIIEEIVVHYMKTIWHRRLAIDIREPKQVSLSKEGHL